MKYITKKLFIAILLCTIYIVPLQHAHAQTVPIQSLRVTPIITDLHLVSGKITTFPVVIQNLSNDPLGIHIDLSGYDQIGEIPLTEQKPSDLIKWTSLSDQDMILPPHSKKAITVTINPPSGLAASGYYETLFLTPIVNQDVASKSPIILSRVGSLVLGTIGRLNYADLAKKVEVKDFSPDHTIVNSFPKTISFRVDNHYFTHFDAKPFLTITPLFGNSQTILLPDKHVLPNSARIWDYQPTIGTNRIFYQVHLALSVGDGKKILADTWFVVLPYKLFIVMAVVLIIVYFLIFRQKHIKRFIRVLLHG